MVRDPFSETLKNYKKSSSQSLYFWVLARSEIIEATWVISDIKRSYEIVHHFVHFDYEQSKRQVWVILDIIDRQTQIQILLFTLFRLQVAVLKPKWSYTFLLAMKMSTTVCQIFLNQKFWSCDHLIILVSLTLMHYSDMKEHFFQVYLNIQNFTRSVI